MIRKFKLAVINLLGVPPDRGALDTLRTMRHPAQERLSTWCDHAGISVYLLDRLQSRHLASALPESFRDQLQIRAVANAQRTQELLADFALVNNALGESDVPYLVLKGISLVPDFCTQPEQRHQTDLDFWVEPGRLQDAIAALTPLGYSTYGTLDSGTVTLTSRPTESISRHESIYKAGRPRKIELHTRLLEDTEPVNLQYRLSALRPAVRSRVRNLEFPTLALPDRFLFQVLHAFQHVIGGWARLAWLYETSSCLTRHADDTALWQQVVEPLREDEKLRNAVGLTLEIVRNIFRTPIPEALRFGCTDALPEQIPLWARHFALQFALSGLSGNKNVLLVKQVFVADRRVWREFLFRALVPRKTSHAIRESRGKSAKPTWSNRRDQLAFIWFRLAYHMRSLAVYPVNWLRWQYALRQLPRSHAS